MLIHLCVVYGCINQSYIYPIFHWFYETHSLFLCVLVKNFTLNIYVFIHKEHNQISKWQVKKYVFCPSKSRLSPGDSYDYLKFFIIYLCHCTQSNLSLQYPFTRPFFKILPEREKFSVQLLPFSLSLLSILKCVSFFC